MARFQWFSNAVSRVVHFIRPNTTTASEDPALSILNAIDIESGLSAEEQQRASPPQQASTESISALQIAKTYSSILFSRENLPRITSAALLTICSTGLNFLSPYLFGETIALLSSEDENTTIAGIEVSRSALILMLITSYALSQVVPNLRDQTMIPVTTRNTKKLVKNMTEHLIKKSYHYHVTTELPDEIYIMQKVFSVSAIAAPLFTQVAPTIVEITIACTVLANRYGVEMGLGLFGLLASYVGYGALTAKTIINAREVSLKAGNAAFENFINAIRQYKNMRDFGKFDETIEGLEAALNNMMQADITASLKPMQVGLGYISFSRMHMLFTCLYVGLGIKSGKFSVQEFIALFGYLNQLSILLPGFGQAINQLFASYPDLRFVFKELTKPDEVVDLHPDTPLPIVSGDAPSIEFDNVTFTYPPKPGEDVQPPIFQNLSFKVQPGQKVALVSESGAGKSTIFNLLYGYYTPDQGVIKINGQDISQVSLHSLQNNINLFGQTANLFKGSIRNNIRYGAKNSEQITDEMIWNLARTLGLDNFLQSFNEGLNTDVGENGKALSGGEQQKVAILRGFFKKGCSIRLMDEVTAPFDPQSATRALENIKALSNGLTTLMITHKLTEAQLLDQIIVIEKGKGVIAQGTHNELLESCDLYQKLWSAYIKQESQDQPKADVSPSSSMVKIMTSLGVSTSPVDKDVVYSADPVNNNSSKAEEFTLEDKGNDECNMQTPRNRIFKV